MHTQNDAASEERASHPIVEGLPSTQGLLELMLGGLLLFKFMTEEEKRLYELLASPLQLLLEGSES